MKLKEYYISQLSLTLQCLVATSAAFPTVMLFSSFAFMSFVLLVDYEDKALEKPLKLVLKVGGSEVTELSGSGHDSSYYDDRSDHERERHKEKKKKKKKKSEKDKDKYVDDEERRRRKVSSTKKNLPCILSVLFLAVLKF